jgi:hypothetical protein
MDTLIVFFDETSHALKVLTPMLPPGLERAPWCWILVACTPRATRHTSKWITSNARQSWRSKWAEKAFLEISAPLQASGDRVMTQVAQGRLGEFTDLLLARHPGSRVLDARRPRLGDGILGP